MRFNDACVYVANSVGTLLNQEQMTSFIAAEASQLQEYQLTIGLWIRNHLLPHNHYLCKALEVLGLITPEEKSLFLMEFAQRYWKLVYAKML